MCRLTVVLLLILLCLILVCNSPLKGATTIYVYKHNENNSNNISSPARLLFVQGTVKILRGEKTIYGAEEMDIKEGDRIITGDDSLAVLTLKDKSIVKIHAHTDVELNRVKDYDLSPAKTKNNNNSSTIPTKLKLFWGRIWATVEKSLESPSTFEVDTPNSSAAVHGTSFEVIVLPDGADDEPDNANNLNTTQASPAKYNTGSKVAYESEESLMTRVNVWDGVVGVKDNKQEVLLSKYDNGRVSSSGFNRLPKLSEKHVSSWQKWNRNFDKGLKERIRTINSVSYPLRRLPYEFRRQMLNFPKIKVPERAKLRMHKQHKRMQSIKNNFTPAKTFHEKRVIKTILPRSEKQKLEKPGGMNTKAADGVKHPPDNFNRSKENITHPQVRRR